MANPVALLLSFPPDSYDVHPPTNGTYDREVREYVKQLGRIPGTTLTKTIDGQDTVDVSPKADRGAL